MKNQALRKFVPLNLALVLLVMLLPLACDSDSKQPPKADFSSEPISGFAPLVVKFTDHSTGDINSWVWDFELDGTTDSSEKNPSHKYNYPGIYTVALKITGPDGSDTEIKTGYIQVKEIPVTTTADLNSFRDMAQDADCSDISNRLFLIDGDLILWDWEGSCPDHGYGTLLYKETVDNIVCSVTDSIDGPLYTYNDEAYKGMFLNILENKDGGNLGLSESHTVWQILF